MADLFEGPLNKIAGMLGAKSGKQLGEENKAAGASAAQKKADAAKAVSEKTDRSAATVFQQRAQLQDDVMTELRRQSGSK